MRQLVRIAQAVILQLQGILGFLGLTLVFVILGLIAIAFLKVFLPETKDRSLEELEERFAAGNFR